MKRFCLRVGLLLLGLLLAELCWRAVLFARDSGGPADARVTIDAALRVMGLDAEASAEGTEPDLTRRKFLHPFYGFETVEGHEATAWQFEFARKLRADPSAASTLPLTIVVLGGSQARIFADPVVNGGVAALISTLEAGLPELNREIIVLGHGREAFQQPQQLTLMAYLFSLGLRPDIVVNLDGFNEVGIGLFNREAGQNPLFPAQPMWSEFLRRQSSYQSDSSTWELAFVQRHRANRAAALQRMFPFRLSALASSVLEQYVKSCASEWRDAMASIAEGPDDGLPQVSNGIPFEGGDDAALDVIVESWVNSSVSLDAMCRARGTLYLHVLQPTLHDTGSKPLTEAERLEGAADPVIERGVREGYPLLRAAVPRLREAGVPFLDASGLFADVEERIYYDLCHFNRPGTELLGAAIGRALVEQLQSSDR